MPYQWTTQSDQRWSLRLWPHRSLSSRGFVIFIGATCGMFALPLLASLGSPVLWILLPFLASTVALIWYFLRRSDRDGTLTETLVLHDDQLTLTRQEPRKQDQIWQANPYWVKPELHAKSGPVAHYLTLAGGPRAVELGAFLSPEERVQLHDELADRLRRLDINRHRH